jgi:hypothetical protein
VATADQHLQICARFEAFALRAQSSFPEWAITGLFYAALHLVETHFDLNPTPEGERGFTTHAERDAAVRLLVPEIDESYSALKTASENARYLGVALRPADTDTAKRVWYDPLRQTMQEKIEAHGKHLPSYGIRMR